MVNKISFKNSSKSKMEVFVEPSAESFDLEIGESMSIEFEHFSDLVNDPLQMDWEEGLLVIYEVRQCTMKIYKGNDLVYYTCNLWSSIKPQ